MYLQEVYVQPTNRRYKNMSRKEYIKNSEKEISNINNKRALRTILRFTARMNRIINGGANHE